MDYTINDMIICARAYQEKLISDPYRPTYHFAIPVGEGLPGDPNGAFFADGRYHLMYLYRNELTKGYHWGHISSTDLLHWRCHPDALTTHNGDEGCYSGGAFVDDDGVAYLTYWKFPSVDFALDNGGIEVARAYPPYDNWERIAPIAVNSSREKWGIAKMNADGKSIPIACADPSNIWKANGYYYFQAGNYMVLHHYGLAQDIDEYKSDWTHLFRSKDMKNWEFMGKFYSNPHLDDNCPADNEDDMCPSFLRLGNKKSGGELTDKWLQLFIAHNRGAQYYIGELDNEKFIPKKHGRFSWTNECCFAPEALVDDKNRQIAWFWLTGFLPNSIERFGWAGTLSFPRVIWLENGQLRIAPAEELDILQYNEQKFDIGCVNGKKSVTVKNGEVFRLKAEIDVKNASKVGFVVRENDNGTEYTEIYADIKNKKLVLDITHSGQEGKLVKEEAPFELECDERFSLDIFVDKSVVEVYANERQAVCRNIYPTEPDKSVNVSAISDGADFGIVTAWEMSPTNMY